MQCQHVNNHTGQCGREAIPGTKRCPIHTRSKSDRHEKRMYLLLNHKFRERHAMLSEHEDLRSIREEVGIARMLLEERLNAINTEADLVASCASINTLLLTIEKLTNSCLKLDQSVGNLLSKPVLLKVASDIVQIVLEEVAELPNHEVIVDTISKRILQTISDIEAK